MRAHDLVDDIQTKTEVPPIACSSRSAGRADPVEDPVKPIPRDRGTLTSNRDHELVGRPGNSDLDRLATLAVMDGVAHQVRDCLRQPLAVPLSARSAT